VLESVGIEADSDRLDKLISELNGKDINEVCAAIRVVKDKSLTIPHAAYHGQQCEEGEPSRGQPLSHCASPGLLYH
jgi:ribosomal protein L12E/L44/L45/RPP1/RPP2